VEEKQNPGMVLEELEVLEMKMKIVATLTLGLRPRQRLTKVRAKREAHECGRV
jgi:hypothetical protein